MKTNNAMMQGSLMLKISGVVDESIVDGPGLRYVIFTQGCPHHCPGCHNPQTHDFEGGEWRTVDELFEEYRENPLLSGITFSGGEPWCQPGPLYELAVRVKALGHNVVAFSGYTYEALLERAKTEPAVADLLSVTDLLIDGPYLEAERNLEIKYRGSNNQRLILLSDALKNSPDLKDEVDKIMIIN